MSEPSKVIHKIYEERTNFCVIGLTGRTGSGCSTVAEILSQEIKEVDLPLPNQSNFTSNEERKYKIIYNYIYNNWQPFYKVIITDIITLFVLENTIEEFAKFIDNNFNDSKKDGFIAKIKDQYEEIYKSRNEYRQKIKDIENGTINKQINQEEYKNSINDCYDFYFKKLNEFTNKLKRAMDNVYPKLGYTKYTN